MKPRRKNTISKKVFDSLNAQIYKDARKEPRRKRGRKCRCVQVAKGVKEIRCKKHLTEALVAGLSKGCINFTGFRCSFINTEPKVGARTA